MQVVDRNNRFALDFYSKIKEIDGNQEANIFCSPWSISTAFALLREGARGETADELESVFGLPKDDVTRRKLFATIQDDLNDNQGNYNLSTANGIWIKDGYKLSDDYVRIARESYGSEVSNTAIPSEESRTQINEWVASKTNEKIRELIPEGVLSDLTRLVITNAIYFKGNWSIQFDERATKEADFYVTPKMIARVPMMMLRKARFPYTENDDLQMLELPYRGNKVSMLILLPKDQRGGMRELEASLTLENLSTWKRALRNNTLTLIVPKFKLETDYSLAKILSEMGLPSAFTKDSADLTGITDQERLYVQAVLHKAFVEVNEEGTEAAGATAVIVELTGPWVNPTFRADHPFIFIIQDSETGNILFIGRVVNPLE